MTSTTGIFFTVSNGDSTAICDLSFDTNLRKIDYAEVMLSMKDQHVLVIHLQLQIIEHQSSIMNFKLGVLGVLRHFAQLHSRILLVWVDRPQLEFLH